MTGLCFYLLCVQVVFQGKVHIWLMILSKVSCVCGVPIGCLRKQRLCPKTLLMYCEMTVNKRWKWIYQWIQSKFSSTNRISFLTRQFPIDFLKLSSNIEGKCRNIPNILFEVQIGAVIYVKATEEWKQPAMSEIKWAKARVLARYAVTAE